MASARTPPYGALSYISYDPATTETVEWDAFVRSTPGGSPFHLIAWKRAGEAAFGHRPHYLLAFEGGAGAGGLPLLEMRGVFRWRRPVSGPSRGSGRRATAPPPTAAPL